MLINGRKSMSLKCNYFEAGYFFGRIDQKKLNFLIDLTPDGG
jgi:hypothetical protein